MINLVIKRKAVAILNSETASLEIMSFYTDEELEEILSNYNSNNINWQVIESIKIKG